MLYRLDCKSTEKNKKCIAGKTENIFLSNVDLPKKNV